MQSSKLATSIAPLFFCTAAASRMWSLWPCVRSTWVTPSAGPSQPLPQDGLPERNGSIRIFALPVSTRKAEWPYQVIFMRVPPARFVAAERIGRGAVEVKRKARRSGDHDDRRAAGAARTGRNACRHRPRRQDDRARRLGPLARLRASAAGHHAQKILGRRRGAARGPAQGRRARRGDRPAGQHGRQRGAARAGVARLRAQHRKAHATCRSCSGTSGCRRSPPSGR